MTAETIDISSGISDWNPLIAYSTAAPITAPLAANALRTRSRDLAAVDGVS